MRTRSLGETGQESSILTLGAIALASLEQEGANRLVELALDRGVNHVDVAPTYGDAELKLGPKLRQHREDLFVGCKTGKRDYDGAKAELERSLTRLGVETIDLYQIHGLEAEAELDELTDGESALDAIRAARDEGTVEHVGLTSHGEPALVLDAIDRIDDLETVMFPLNPVVVGTDDDPGYGAVLERAREEGIGTLAIKTFARGPWPSTDVLPRADRPYANWYEPVGTTEAVRERFDFVASQGVTSVVSPGDPKLVAMVLEAADRYEEMDAAEQRALVERCRDDESPVPAQLHH